MALKAILVLFQGVASLASAAIIANIGNQHDDGSGLLLLGPNTTLLNQIRTVISQIDEMSIKNGISGRAYRIGSAAELIVSSMPRQAVAAS